MSLTLNVVLFAQLVALKAYKLTRDQNKIIMMDQCMLGNFQFACFW